MMMMIAYCCYISAYYISPDTIIKEHNKDFLQPGNFPLEGPEQLSVLLKSTVCYLNDMDAAQWRPSTQPLSIVG